MSSMRIARCGLCCALLVCSAWISLTFGPVPFTLQTLVLALLPQVLPRRDAVLTVAVYVVLGLVGLPVFANFQGGIGALAGPTGGFIWGFIVSMVPAAAIMRAEALPMPALARTVLGAVVLLLVCYACGTAQLVVLGGMSVPAALAVAVLPFIVPDAVKVAASIVLARAINRVSVPHRA